MLLEIHCLNVLQWVVGQRLKGAGWCPVREPIQVKVSYSHTTDQLIIMVPNGGGTTVMY